MPVVSKATFKPPAPRKETIEVAGIGEVVVRGLMLSERLALIALEDSQGYRHVAQQLAYCVLDDAGEPLMTADEWDVWAAQNLQAWSGIIKTIRKLSGSDLGDVAKN